MAPGKVWLDEIRKRLSQSKTVVPSLVKIGKGREPSDSLVVVSTKRSSGGILLLTFPKSKPYTFQTLVA
jgi:hypothetical protein